MPVFTKILLRTKVSGEVETSELEPREIVYGDLDSAIYIRAVNGTLHKYGKIEDGELNSNICWSASKIQSLFGGDTSLYIFDELPVGDIDGVNTDFITQYDSVDGSLEVFLNGIKLRVGLTNDFIIIDENEFRMNYPPLSGDLITVNYIRNTEE